MRYVFIVACDGILFPICVTYGCYKHDEQLYIVCPSACDIRDDTLGSYSSN